VKKDYGKLTAPQFQEFIEILPDVFAKLRQADDLLASTPATRFDQVFPGDCDDYSHFYELPFVEHVSWVVLALNRQEEVKDVASSSDPQEAILAMLRQRDEVEDKPQHEAFTDEDVLTLVYSLNRTMQSMATYGRSISSLLQDARENNNHDSLFKAIRMDSTVIGAPTAMRHLTKAQIRGDKRFFKHLQAALKGPSKKPMIGLEPMRYALLLLREMGIHDLSEKDLEHLMVDLLKVYPRAPGAAKNLRAQYQRSRKIKTI
jgi:hypothetical protein